MSANDEMSIELCVRALRINQVAPFLLESAALSHIIAQGNGAIVNTASEAGLRRSCAGTLYTVSKPGVIGLTKSDAIMYRNRRIHINAVAHGGTKTNIFVVLIAGYMAGLLFN